MITMPVERFSVLVNEARKRFADWANDMSVVKRRESEETLQQLELFLGLMNARAIEYVTLDRADVLFLASWTHKAGASR